MGGLGAPTGLEHSLWAHGHGALLVPKTEAEA